MSEAKESTLSQRMTQTPEGMRVWQQERAIIEVTERLCGLMEEQSVTRSELARRLGTSKGYVSQLLDGTKNLTIRTISDAFLALGRAFHVHDGPITLENDPGPRLLCVFDTSDENRAEWQDDFQPQLQVRVGR